MDMQIKAGKEVVLHSALGDITRTVVTIRGNVVAVCLSDEYRRANRERREPAAVGFRLDDIVRSG